MKASLTGAKVLGTAVGLFFITIAGVASAQYYGGYGSYQQTYSYPSYQQPYGYTGYQGYSYYSCPQLYSNLYYGMRNSQVTALQQFLAGRYGQTVSGYFGPQTYSNVMRFQREQGIYPSGTVDSITRSAISRTCGNSGYPYPDYDNEGEIIISEPDRGDDFDAGDEMTIEWRTDDEPTGSFIELELFREGGRRVGTIDEVSARDNDFDWDIPTSLSGDYYIRATLMDRSGRTLDTAQSGIFTIHDDSDDDNDDDDVYEFSARPTSGYEPLRVTFTIVAEAGEYTIDFDDGDEREVRVPAIYCITTPCYPQAVYITHTFDDQGTYDVELTDEDNDVVGREEIRVR